MANITSRADKPLHMKNGHHSPRQKKDQADRKPTSVVMEELRMALLVQDIPSSRQFRKSGVNICKQRWPNILRLLAESGFIKLEGYGIKPGPRFEEKWVLSTAFEAQLARAEGHPKGTYHVICTLCGNTKKLVTSKGEADSWYQDTHLKNSVGHR